VTLNFISLLEPPRSREVQSRKKLGVPLFLVFLKAKISVFESMTWDPSKKGEGSCGANKLDTELIQFENLLKIEK
jgi:hypothetical protein